jgi:hypothetical protein
VSGLERKWVKRGLAACLVLAGAGRVCVLAPSGNPYQTIVGRNVFGLKAPRVPQPETPPSPPPKLTLTGITTILGDRRVLLKIEYPAKAYQRKPKVDSCLLTEGQRYGEVEVLAIDVNARRVKVKVGETVTELTFEKNGVHEAPAAPPTPARPPSVSPGSRLTAGTRRTW